MVYVACFVYYQTCPYDTHVFIENYFKYSGNINWILDMSIYISLTISSNTKLESWIIFLDV
jgi:hypothetical protein